MRPIGAGARVYPFKDYYISPRGVGLVLKKGVKETRAGFEARRRSRLQAQGLFVQKDGQEIVRDGKEEKEVEEGAVEKVGKKANKENLEVAPAEGEEGQAVRRMRRLLRSWVKGGRPSQAAAAPPLR